MAVRATVASALCVAGLAVPAVVATASAQGGYQPTRTVVSGVNVDVTTIPQLERLMNHHRLSSADLVGFYLDRIARLNPALHAVITTSPTAARDARAADRKRARGVRLPMLGIPILVKDNVDTTGMPTTAGSLALARNTPTDSFMVRRLKAAGAIVLGKTNLSEWANYRSTQSSSGWSGVGGQAHMPYVLDRNPCGSSAGSGAAAAADLATVTIGTETDGSIVCPAGQNGDVGIKPTLGLVSRSGIVPLSAQQDTAGPITRNVTDAAVVLGAITGVDRTDRATVAQRGHVFAHYTQFLRAGSLKGARIGIWRKGNFGASPETDAVMRRAIARLKALGATVVDRTNVPIEAAYNDENTALLSEFRHDINAYLAAHTAPGQPRTLAGLIRFDRRHHAREMHWFGQEIFLQARQAPPVTNAGYKAARARARSVARHSIDDTMAKYNLDAILAPTNSPAWTTDLVNGDHFSVGSSSPAAISGYASITVPAGYSDHLPVGMSLIGGRWDEPRLLGLAYAWEHATHIRHAPGFLAHIGG